MKRALFLLVLVMLVVWLAQDAPATGNPGSVKDAATLNSAASTAAAPSAAANVAALQESCCLNPGETDPHWECFSGACYQVSGCGENVNCANCGCDPNAEWACINDGGEWDPYSCSCSYSCDPGGYNESYCWQTGGSWDPWSCTCDPPECNPGQPYETYSDHWRDYYCDGYYYVDCDNWCSHYEQYCQDGSLYNQWTECTSSCIPSDDYCGDDDGGGGCWDGGDCWCDWDWGICCDEDYCYDMEE